MRNEETRCGKGLGCRFAALCLNVHCVVFASLSLGASAGVRLGVADWSLFGNGAEAK